MARPVHVVIISWDGYFERALAIAKQLAGTVARLSVIYSNAEGLKETGPGDWIEVPQSWFYGRKFQKSLELHDSDAIMLQIQADAGCDDWPAMVADCARSFDQHPEIAIWSPDIDWTPWPNDVVGLGVLKGTSLLRVAQTDGIVWAISPKIIDVLRGLDYSNNNLGWGIDWVAVCSARLQGLESVRDMTHKVSHPKSRGYNGAEASQHMKEFIAPLSADLRLEILSLHDRLQKNKTYVEDFTDVEPPLSDAMLLTRKATLEKHMLSSSRLSQISEIYLYEGHVFVKAQRNDADTGFHLRCGARNVQFTSLDQAPSIKTLPRSFPISEHDQQGSYQTLNNLEDWQVPGWSTLRVIPDNMIGSQVIPLGGSLIVEPSDGAVTFAVELACHRAKGMLIVTLSDSDGSDPKRISPPLMVCMRAVRPTKVTSALS